MIRTSLRQYPYGSGFGRTGMATYGGAWSGTSNFQDTREDATKAHPYFDWLQRTGKAYGQDSYGEWANALPPGSAVPPAPPPQGVFPNDPTSPTYQAPGRGGGPSSIATPARPANVTPKMPVTGSKYVGSSADGTQFIWELPDGTQRAFGADGLPTEGQWDPSKYANASKASGTGAGAGGAGAGAGTGSATSGVGRTVTGRMADGSTVTGIVTGEDNGQTTVRWGDGTVTSYDGSGNLVSTSPPPKPTQTPQKPLPTDSAATTTYTPPVVSPSDPNAVASGSATAVSGIPGVPPPIAPSGPDVTAAGSAIDVSGIAGMPPTNYTPPLAPSGPNAVASGSAEDVSGISWASGWGPNGAIPPPPDVSAAIGTLGAMPPPDTNYTIPPEYAIQLPPPIDEGGGGAGDLLAAN